jgi:hypothetical protein
MGGEGMPFPEKSLISPKKDIGAMNSNGIVNCMIPGISNNKSVGSMAFCRKGPNINPFDIVPSPKHGKEYQQLKFYNQMNKVVDTDTDMSKDLSFSYNTITNPVGEINPVILKQKQRMSPVRNAGHHVLSQIF